MRLHPPRRVDLVFCFPISVSLQSPVATLRSVLEVQLHCRLTPGFTGDRSLRCHLRPEHQYTSPTTDSPRSGQPVFDPGVSPYTSIKVATFVSKVATGHKKWGRITPRRRPPGPIVSVNCIGGSVNLFVPTTQWRSSLFWHRKTGGIKSKTACRLEEDVRH